MPFYDKTRNGITQKILPSSVHEVLAIPDDGKQDPKHLKRMVETVNRNEVSVSEQLSDNVYYYDGKRISICRDIEVGVA